ncbi:hypothetical protein HU200_042882 [Digitaria exilis]|uniref:IBH1-like N-terminal domain-containing protein n=1 Tax=Digitaria exilis TaxID=1010633 RepID=A0A835B4N5_9POAL|nr:hypothetical protein HU200_042882 [Digitaria exilis]
MAPAFKRELLKNLLLGLRARTEACSFDAMSIHDRKLSIKLSADVAMAAARGVAGGHARWPTAIMAAAAAASSGNPRTCKAARSRCKRVVRRCVDAKRMRRGCCAAARSAAAATSSEVARRMVRRRTMALRKMIPGGDAAGDEAALLREAMDYVVHLRAQVDVLRRVSAAVQTSTVVLRYGSCSEYGRIVVTDGSEKDEHLKEDHASGMI